MAGIHDVLRKLGFTTAETEPLAATVYAKSGEAALVFAGGLVNGYVREQLANPENTLSETELKRIVLRTVLASSFAGFAAALVEADIRTEDLRQVFDDVTAFVRDAKQKRSKPPSPLN